jgi:5'-nucleotidase
MERGEFIKQVGLGGIAAIQAPSLFSIESSKKTQKITILHTNDTHSNIDAFPENHAKHPNQGGVSKRYEVIQQIRQEEDHVLLLDAGDIFQGTPYFNRFGGVLEMKVMTELGYDAATMGNHDFDGGMDGFMKAKEHAKFPFICSNYDFKNTLLDGLTFPHKIINKGGIKIGIFGLGVELNGLVPKALYKETVYLDPIESAQEQVKKLKDEKCDLILCLSHLGYSYETEKISDLKLAQKTKGIHAIIGGHTHTFLEKPVTQYNLEGKLTLINQAGWAGLQLGRIDFEIGKQSKKEGKNIVIE